MTCPMYTCLHAVFACPTGTRFGAEVGSANSLVLFVRANDEPYGDFQFSTVS